MKPQSNGYKKIYPDLPVRSENVPQNSSTLKPSISVRNPQTPNGPQRKPTVFPTSFSDDTKPYAVSTPPEQTAFRTILPSSPKLIKTHRRQSGSLSSISPKPNLTQAKPRSQYTGKVEEVDDSFKGQPSRISGCRKSEPSANGLAADIQRLNLNELPNTPSKRKPRQSEPAQTYGSSPSQSSSNHKRTPKPTVDPTSSTDSGKPTYALFNLSRSHDYPLSDTTLEYSDYRLKPHQAYARLVMAEMERNGRRGGILADEMGLGKTLEMLVRIKDDKLNAIKRGEDIGPTLVVGPKSILLQWQEEIRRMFCHDERLRCIIYHGSDRGKRFSEILGETDIVLTTYGILKNDYDLSLKDPATDSTDTTTDNTDTATPNKTATPGKKSTLNKKATSNEKATPANLFRLIWRRLVLDEAHEIRNPEAKKTLAALAVKAVLVWCLTGTPIQNRLLDLYSFFHLLGIEDFSDLQWYKDNIEGSKKKPPYTPNPGGQVKLKELLEKVMLRRLKSDRVNGSPILELPELRINILDCQFSPPERRFYIALETRMRHIIEELSRQLDEGDIHFYTTAWVILLRLRQACLHPALLVKERQVEQDVEDAGSKEKRRDVSQTDDKCPLCRRTTVSASHKRECQELIDMAKIFRRSLASMKIKITLEILREIRARPGSEKTIIFSQFTSMLDILQPFLEKQGIRFSRLDGTMDMKNRQEHLKNLKEMPRVTVILVSLMAGGVGLNLTECNNVILFDLWWNPAVEEQAFARAHRMGQTKPVNVYKLVTQNTVEGRIMELQDAKRKIATETLDRNEVDNMQSLSKEQLLHLMSGR
ncbi:SNF2 family N-terminal domain-containing protein [Lentinula raphanica]|nr:SNF2 family N-terminal domain-containing protein [Lentinula raphanica]